MGKRRRRNKAKQKQEHKELERRIYSGPIAVLLLGDDHDMTRDDLIDYISGILKTTRKARGK